MFARYFMCNFQDRKFSVRRGCLECHPFSTVCVKSAFITMRILRFGAHFFATFLETIMGMRLFLLNRQFSFKRHEIYTHTIGNLKNLVVIHFIYLVHSLFRTFSSSWTNSKSPFPPYNTISDMYRVLHIASKVSQRDI
jgi:hypothetical protein